eukprot:TRINITY_DN1945_c0_g1_i1.p1 TRINITY_DN1945_c0_g1~~TRINITY_DN1945_c0_g1_i1.p1  ORF type:complete len:633 (-),score=176.87 TRINITY_DN1945_c0_g1_i1:2228-4126(-)
MGLRSRLKKIVKSTVNKIGEYVQTRNYIDELTEHWDELITELENYTKHSENEIDNVDINTTIPVVLQNILDLLIFEENDRTSNNYAGECLQYFLTNNLFKILLEYGKNDQPNGMVRLCIAFCSHLLKSIPVIMVQSTVSQPLNSFLEGLYGNMLKKSDKFQLIPESCEFQYPTEELVIESTIDIFDNLNWLIECILTALVSFPGKELYITDNFVTMGAIFSVYKIKTFERFCEFFNMYPEFSEGFYKLYKQTLIKTLVFRLLKISVSTDENQLVEFKQSFDLINMFDKLSYKPFKECFMKECNETLKDVFEEQLISGNHSCKKGILKLMIFGCWKLSFENIVFFANFVKFMPQLIEEGEEEISKLACEYTSAVLNLNFANKELSDLKTLFTCSEPIEKPSLKIFSTLETMLLLRTNIKGCTINDYRFEAQRRLASVNSSLIKNSLTNCHSFDELYQSFDKYNVLDDQFTEKNKDFLKNMKQAIINKFLNYALNSNAFNLCLFELIIDIMLFTPNFGIFLLGDVDKSIKIFNKTEIETKDNVEVDTNPDKSCEIENELDGLVSALTIVVDGILHELEGFDNWDIQLKQLSEAFLTNHNVKNVKPDLERIIVNYTTLEQFIHQLIAHIELVFVC